MIDGYGWRFQHEGLLEAINHIWQTRVAFHISRGQESYLPPWYQESLIEKESTDVLSLLLRARFLMATDPRDKIFAILGISTGFDWQSLGTIDYQKNTRDVYSTFARDLMSARRDYRALSYLNSASSPEHLSWRSDCWDRESKRVMFLSQQLQLYGRRSYPFSQARTILRTGVESFWDLHPDCRPKDEEHPDEGTGGPLIEDSDLHSVDNYVQHFHDLYTGCVNGGDFENLELPTWVSNWRCLRSVNWDPCRPIVEAVQSSDAPETVDKFRAWASNDRLVIQGQFIGNLHTALASASLLTRDEKVFEELKAKWQRNPDYQKHPLDSQILTLWAYLLDETAFTSKGYAPDGMSVVTVSPEFCRSQTKKYDVDEILSHPPGRYYKDAKTHFSFLEYLNIKQSPPVPGSIEERLVARARNTVQWSVADPQVIQVVNDRSSILEQRLLGIFTPNGYFTDIDGSDSSTSSLILLPSGAKLMDCVVYFPGADVPFLVRKHGKLTPRNSERLRGSLEGELGPGSLPSLEGDEFHAHCELIGECWFDNFYDYRKNEMKNNVVFHIV